MPAPVGERDNAEVMAVLKLCVAQGVLVCDLAIPIWTQELAALVPPTKDAADEP